MQQLSSQSQRDVAQWDMDKFLEENCPHKTLKDLNPWEKVSAYLQCNGIINYTDGIIAAMEAAGWKLDK